MSSHADNVIRAWPQAVPDASVIVGRLVSLRDGRPEVEFDWGEGQQRAVARVLQSPGLGEAPWCEGQEVLVVLERGEPSRPIIVGRIADVVTPAAEQSLSIDVRSLALAGQQELVLRCGDASIVLRADGDVVVKGVRLLSRALESNKIRGATVLIN